MLPAAGPSCRESRWCACACVCVYARAGAGYMFAHVVRTSASGRQRRRHCCRWWRCGGGIHMCACHCVYPMRRETSHGMPMVTRWSVHAQSIGINATMARDNIDEADDDGGDGGQTMMMMLAFALLARALSHTYIYAKKSVVCSVSTAAETWWITTDYTLCVCLRLQSCAGALVKNQRVYLCETLRAHQHVSIHEHQVRVCNAWLWHYALYACMRQSKHSALFSTNDTRAFRCRLSSVIQVIYVIFSRCRGTLITSTMWAAFVHWWTLHEHIVCFPTQFGK